jgi:hypothetical protein
MNFAILVTTMIVAHNGHSSIQQSTLDAVYESPQHCESVARTMRFQRSVDDGHTAIPMVITRTAECYPRGD